MSTFGARDLALLLPDQVGETISFRQNEPVEDNFQPLLPKLDPSKKTR
jgi:hypothetical protein